MSIVSRDILESNPDDFTWQTKELARQVEQLEEDLKSEKAHADRLETVLEYAGCLDIQKCLKGTPDPCKVCEAVAAHKARRGK